MRHDSVRLDILADAVLENSVVANGWPLERPADLVRRRGPRPGFDPSHLTKISGGCELTPARRLDDSYLVDSASSHMLVSKIKPCMSKYKQSYCETANGSLNQLSFI